MATLAESSRYLGNCDAPGQKVHGSAEGGTGATEAGEGGDRERGEAAAAAGGKRAVVDDDDEADDDEEELDAAKTTGLPHN